MTCENDTIVHLLDLIFPPREDESVIRDLSPSAFAALLSPALVPATRPAAIGLLPFRAPPVRAAVHEAKYHGTERAFTLLAAALADFLPEYLADRSTGRVALVPIPLGRTRLKERGYNQVEEVAKRAVRIVREPAVALSPALLSRVRETPTQVSLARKEREENMRGAFVATRPAAPADLYIVLDDVLTTGATLSAGIEALAEAGLDREQILPLALAH